MAWADPVLDDGAAADSGLFELDALFAVVPEPLAAEAAACDVALDPGRVTATTPAVTSPAAPTETVAARSVARPR